MFKLTAIFRESNSMDPHSGRKADKFLMWVDGVGGYLVCLGDDITLGQPSGSKPVDVPILGDLSTRHARIWRDGEAYLVEAIRDVRVDGRKVERMASLNDGSQIQLGEGVTLDFRRPHSLSATVRLDFASRHRTQHSTDAVLLMADSCILGPKPFDHVVCRDWPQEVILYRHQDQLYCRTVGSIEIDNRRVRDHGPITLDSRIIGEQFSLSLESL